MAEIQNKNKNTNFSTAGCKQLIKSPRRTNAVDFPVVTIDTTTVHLNRRNGCKNCKLSSITSVGEVYRVHTQAIDASRTTLLKRPVQ